MLRVALEGSSLMEHHREMLPENKQAFPKFLYLDQNKWIDLGRAHYARDGGAAFLPALEAVREAVAAQKLVVPISGVHVMETMAPADQNRRQRLAQFMVDTAQNLFVLPYMSIRSLEILYAVRRVLGQIPSDSLRTALVRQGIWYALGAEAEITGVPPAVRESLMADLLKPETTVRMLVEAGDRATIDQARQEDIDAVLALEETRRRARAAMNDDMRHRVELADMFSNGEPGRELQSVLRAIAMPARDFFARLGQPDDYLRFFHDVPTMDVFVTLGLARDRDIARPIHRNDLKDISFMAVAVPYANIVIAERYWTHNVTATRLAEKYGTVVESDATQLPQLLRDAGCI